MSSPPPASAGTRVVDLTLLLAEEPPCSWLTHMNYQQETFSRSGDQASPDAVLRSRTGPYAADGPVGRVGTVDDVAALRVHLVGPDAGHTTGAVHDVDGGAQIS